MRRPALLAIAACFSLTAGIPGIFGQSAISIRSGLVNFFEGDVLVNGRPLQRLPGTFTSLKAGSDLLTRAGRAQLLLPPNTYLRVGRQSAVRLVSDSFADTRIDLLGGSVVLDSSMATAKMPVTITIRTTTVRMLIPGRYRLDSDPRQLRVFEGEAEVEDDGQKVKAESRQVLPLNGAPIVTQIKDGSDFLLDDWSWERHALIAGNSADARRILSLTDTDSTLAANYSLPEYVPVSGYSPSVPGGIYTGGTYRGLNDGYGSLGFGVGSFGFGAFGIGGYGPYGISSPYSPYGPYGLHPAGVGVYSPVYGGIVPNNGFVPARVHPFSPNPVTGGAPNTVNAPRPVMPRPIAPHVGPHR